MFNYTHEITVDVSTCREIKSAITRQGQAPYTWSAVQQLSDLLLGAGPRAYRITARWDEQGTRLTLEIIERHSLVHLLMRLFWAPLEILRGRNPLRLKLSTLVSLESLALIAMDRAATQPTQPKSPA